MRTYQNTASPDFTGLLFEISVKCWPLIFDADDKVICPGSQHIACDWAQTCNP